MLKKLAAWFKPSSVGPRERDFSIPAEALSAVQEGKFEPIRDWVVEEARRVIGLPYLDAIIGRLRQEKMPAEDLVKLRILGLYYSRRFEEVLQDVDTFYGNTKFDPDVFILAMFTLYMLDRYESAWEKLRQSEAWENIFSGRSDYFVVGALICAAANKMDSLQRYVDEARKLAPEDPIVALNAHAMYFELGVMDSFELVDAEFKSGKHFVDKSGFALAIARLAQDDYIEGFQYFESRYEAEEAFRYINMALSTRPRWLGQSLDGKTLLVSAEQGLGDTIQFVRYLIGLDERFNCRVVMETQPETLTWLQFNFPDIEIVVRGYDHLPDVHFDVWTGMMSLPHFHRTTCETVPHRNGYLKIQPDTQEYWQRRVAELSANGRFRVGVAWSGRPTHRADRRRSVNFELLSKFLDATDADFFAIQTSVPQVKPSNLFDVSEEMVTLSDTASLVSQMDIVITVDTSVVHVSGAIGKETWLMLPYRYEWRWGLEGKDSRWYDSVSVYRQSEHMNWDAVLKRVFEVDLPIRIANRST